MQSMLDAAAKASEAAQQAASQASAQAAAAARGTMEATGAAAGSPARAKSDKMDYFASSKLFAGGEEPSEFDVEAPVGAGAAASGGSAWGALFGGAAGEGAGGDGEGAEVRFPPLFSVIFNSNMQILPLFRAF